MPTKRKISGEFAVLMSLDFKFVTNLMKNTENASS
jgi:hypothetical protein